MEVGLSITNLADLRKVLETESYGYEINCKGKIIGSLFDVCSKKTDEETLSDTIWCLNELITWGTNEHILQND